MMTLSSPVPTFLVLPPLSVCFLSEEEKDTVLSSKMLPFQPVGSILSHLFQDFTPSLLYLKFFCFQSKQPK